MRTSNDNSGSEAVTPGATMQPRANEGLIYWLVALPYLMGALTGCTGGNQKNILEAGRSSRPIPRFAGRKDTLNLVSGALTAGVPNVQVCRAKSLLLNFLLSLEPCLKYSQNTTL